MQNADEDKNPTGCKSPRFDGIDGYSKDIMHNIVYMSNLTSFEDVVPMESDVVNIFTSGRGSNKQAKRGASILAPRLEGSWARYEKKKKKRLADWWEREGGRDIDGRED